MTADNRNKVVRTVCSLPDGDSCGLSMRVNNGVITDIKPAEFPERAHRGANPAATDFRRMNAVMEAKKNGSSDAFMVNGRDTSRFQRSYAGNFAPSLT